VTDYKMSAEPGHHEVLGAPAGMTALVGAWARRRTELDAAVKAAAAAGAAPGKALAEILRRQEAQLDAAVKAAAAAAAAPGDALAEMLRRQEAQMQAALKAAAAAAATPGDALTAALRRQAELEAAVRRVLSAHLDLRATVRPVADASETEGETAVVEQERAEPPELLIPAAIIAVGDKVPEGHLVEAVMLPFFDIVKALERDPNFVHQLVKNWRVMEELVAGAYHREGWSEVILTPRSGDLGRDIIVSRPDWGTIRIYDQVKAYSPGHPVPAADVRELVGVLTRDRNVSKAVLTTTTLFAPGVCEEWAAFIPYRLALRDGPALTRWLIGLLPGRS